MGAVRKSSCLTLNITYSVSQKKSLVVLLKTTVINKRDTP